MWTQEHDSNYWLKLGGEWAFVVEIHLSRAEGFPLAEVVETADSGAKVRCSWLNLGSIAECRQMASVLNYAAAIAANIEAYKELLKEGEKPIDPYTQSLANAIAIEMSLLPSELPDNEKIQVVIAKVAELITQLAKESYMKAVKSTSAIRSVVTAAQWLYYQPAVSDEIGVHLKEATMMAIAGEVNIDWSVDTKDNLAVVVMEGIEAALRVRGVKVG